MQSACQATKTERLQAAMPTQLERWMLFRLTSFPFLLGMLLPRLRTWLSANGSRRRSSCCVLRS